MQETRSPVERQDQWKKEWGAPILFSHGKSNARGVAILIRNGLDITIQLSEISSDGRFIIIKAVIKMNYIQLRIYMVQTKTQKLSDFIEIYQSR